MFTARKTNGATAAALDRQRQADEPASKLAEELRLLAHENMRLSQQVEAMRQRVANLEAENDRLAARAFALSRAASPRPETATEGSPFREEGAGVGCLTVEGRAVVNQTQAADLLGVKQYTVSRWVAAGHFQTTRIGARVYIFADTLHKPAPKARRKGG